MTPKSRILGACMAIRGEQRCNAPATRTYYDWLTCSDCYGNGRFQWSVSLLTEPKKGEAVLQSANEGVSLGNGQ